MPFCECVPDDRCGSNSLIQRCPLKCPVCPKANAIRRSMSTRPLPATPCAQPGATVPRPPSPRVPRVPALVMPPAGLLAAQHRSSSGALSGHVCYPSLIMDEARNRERLSLADRHIAEVNGYILRLQRRIKRLGTDGHDIERAQSLLDALEGSLRAFEFHRPLIVPRLNPLDNAVSRFE